jgi:hypothetical protein
MGGPGRTGRQPASSSVRLTIGNGAPAAVAVVCRPARARVFSHVKQVCYLGLRGAREGGIDGGPWPDRPAASQ